MIRLSSFLSFSFPERIGMICIAVNYVRFIKMVHYYYKTGSRANSTPVFKSHDSFLLTNCLLPLQGMCAYNAQTCQPCCPLNLFMYVSKIQSSYFLAFFTCAWGKSCPMRPVTGCMERKCISVHFYLFESFSRPMHKTNVSRGDWMHSFNFVYKPTSALLFSESNAHAFIIIIIIVTLRPHRQSIHVAASVYYLTTSPGFLPALCKK